MNVAIGLVTSVLSGGLVWLWQRGKVIRAVHRRARFFGLSPGETCIVVMNNRWDKPGSTSHHDVQAMVEAVVLAHGVGCSVSVRSSDEFREGNDEFVEFCIGGPEGGSNVRSGGHLTRNLPGVVIRPFSRRRDSLAIIVDGERFLRDRGNIEYAIAAKFTPPGATRPVILICGQSAITNHAAIYFLSHSYHEISKLVVNIDRFCLIVRVDAIGTYGFRGGFLARDVSVVAFGR